MSDVFEALLEKKGRGRSAFAISRPWAVRTFRLSGQTLEYFDVDKLKGSVDVRDGVCKLVSAEEADNKPFPFELDVGKEKILLNAPNEMIRKKCMEVFTAASKDPNWLANSRYSLNRASVQTQQKIDNLEVYQQKLEQELQQQQTTATLAILQEQAIQKDLKGAAEAERKQQEQQKLQALQMFKSMGAKARFRAAKEMGETRIAIEAAATMVQNTWRAKEARRKALIQKQEKERLRMSAAARKIQTRYRVKMAKRRVNGIKAEKLKNKMNLAALKFQCLWRRFKAHKVVSKRRDNLLQEVVFKTVQRQKGIIRMQKQMRRFLAFKQQALRQTELPSVIHVTVIEVEGLGGAHASSVNSGVIITGLSLNVARDHKALTDLRYKVPDDLLKTAKVTSHDRSESVGSQLPAMATSSNNLDFIAVTLVDRANGAKDDCFGQAFIRVADVRRKRKNTDGSVTLKLPLMSLTIAVEDYAGGVVSRRPATGFVTVKVQIANPSYSMCGWLWKMSEKMLGGNTWKKRWFVLVDGYLVYSNSELALEATKHVINCSKITSISQEPCKGRMGTKVCYKNDSNTSTFWQLDFDEDAPPSITRMWQRRLFNNASAASNPEIESLKKKFNIIKTGEINGAVAPQKRVGKRSSVLGGPAR